VFLSDGIHLSQVIIGLFLILVISWFDSAKFPEIEVFGIILMVPCNDEVME
jgi:hypothetical protein